LLAIVRMELVPYAAMVVVEIALLLGVSLIFEVQVELVEVRWLAHCFLGQLIYLISEQSKVLFGFVIDAPVLDWRLTALCNVDGH